MAFRSKRGALGCAPLILLVVSSSLGCGSGTTADIPPPKMTVKMPMPTAAQAKQEADQFLRQLEMTPKPLRTRFALMHVKGRDAVKLANDPQMTARLQADLAAK
jgi:hypothetical protein